MSALDVVAVAAELAMTKSAVRKAIARGTLAASRVPTRRGTKYVVEVAEVARYRCDHRTERRS